MITRAASRVLSFLREGSRMSPARRAFAEAREDSYCPSAHRYLWFFASLITRRVVTLVVAISMIATTSSAWAQTSDEERAAIRNMGEEAVKAYDNGEYERAYDLFKRTHAIVGMTTTGLYVARCLVKLERFVEASERYIEVGQIKLPTDADPVHREAKVTAQEERDKLLPRIPRLMVALEGSDISGVVVSLDGKKVPAALVGVARPVDPGDHVVVAIRGTDQREERITLAEGETRTITINFSAAAPPPPAPPMPPPPRDDAPSDNGSFLQTLGFVAIGVGGAGLVVGAITGGLALDKRSSLTDSCPNKECQPAQFDDLSTYQTMRIVSGIGFIAGGVLAATGIVLVILSPSSETTADSALSITVTPNGASLIGTF